MKDRLASAALADCSRSLVAAQLRAGQHVLTFGQAMVVADGLTIPRDRVRPGLGDATAFKLREPRA